MSDKVLKFLQVVGSQFAKRHASPADEKIWVESMINGLRGYDASVLARAGQRIIMSKTDPGFPYLAECRKVCEEVIKIERAERAPKFDEAAKAKELADSHDWKTKLADGLIMCEIGRRAAREGWILSLHDFCRLNGRLPSEDWQIRKCIEAARGFNQAYEDVLNGGGGVCSKTLERLGDAMLKRRESLRERVLGKEAA